MRMTVSLFLKVLSFTLKGSDDVLKILDGMTNNAEAQFQVPPQHKPLVCVWWCDSAGQTSGAGASLQFG